MAGTPTRVVAHGLRFSSTWEAENPNNTRCCFATARHTNKERGERGRQVNNCAGEPPILCAPFHASKAIGVMGKTTEPAFWEGGPSNPVREYRRCQSAPLSAHVYPQQAGAGRSLGRTSRGERGKGGPPPSGQGKAAFPLLGGVRTGTPDPQVQKGLIHGGTS